MAQSSGEEDSVTAGAVMARTEDAGTEDVEATGTESIEATGC